MVERRELITICRQIGTMMEVGVDFLRLTRALREQTDNPRLLELYDQLEHDMRMGENLADAIAKAPDVFSPFAVSLIRQGEARGDVEGAWHRLADSLKQEAQEDKDLGLELADSTKNEGAPRVSTTSLSTTPRGVSPILTGEPAWMALLERAAKRVLLGGAAFLAVLAALWRVAGIGLISWEVMVPLQLFLAALWLLGLAVWRRPKHRPPTLGLKTTDLMKKELVLAAAEEPETSSATRVQAPVRDSATRTEELLRNFAPTFPIIEESPGEFEEVEDDFETPPPHNEKRFQL